MANSADRHEFCPSTVSKQGFLGWPPSVVDVGEYDPEWGCARNPGTDGCLC